ncbi:MAG TPA: Ig-like domain-containing protein, partial [Casimicrobiaceae bacterium]|nr:Ig-like domain-containing protein [Casimicrobiaceae bacterium]
WLKVPNANFFSDVWTPPDLEPLRNGVTDSPAKIIIAWSGFAWDSNRGDLIIYGGGPMNYAGNDVYRWHSSTLTWERASLPSETYLDPVAGGQAIDGVDSAPVSAHTYDNNTFLPIVDRFLVWGGATYDRGGPYIRVSETNPTTTRIIGPYLFDPNRADGNKVGGITGSHVMRVAPHPEIVGGQMWENRDIHLNLAGQQMPTEHKDSCANTVAEAGRDVVYLGATNVYSTNLDLYRYQLNDITNPKLDQISKVGAFSTGTAGSTTCGFDPVRKLFVRTGSNAVPFTFWDLTTPGPNNPDKRVDINASIAAFQSWLGSQNFNIINCALKFDPVRNVFPIWCGTGAIWVLNPPASGNTTSGWTITQLTTPAQPAPPADTIGVGILGKWRYVPYYDVFIGLENYSEGHIWIFKPAGWSQPNPAGNALPAVSITSPAPGTTIAPGVTLNLTATASDANDAISRVEFYSNGVKVGQDTSAPYTVAWTPLLVGTYKIVAIAVDSVGGMKASAGVDVTVNANLATATLQHGLAGYAGASDTYLDALATTAVRGAATSIYLAPATYTPLMRFAIFQSEGGPVPNGAVVQSASLQVYKQYYDDSLQVNALLKPWVEAQATWLLSQTGAAWSVGGAAGAGTDYNPTADAQVAGSFNPGWVAFDVTSRVRQWSTGATGNFGWRMGQSTGGGNIKEFNASEYAADATLRPKLTVVYAPPPPSNLSPTVAIATPTDGASLALGGSFALTASASDVDGSVTQVEYFANGGKVGQASTTPYSLTWVPAAAGSYVLTARATDNLGATTTSSAITVTVTPASGASTVVLQRGLNGYAGASDTFLDSNLPTAVRGAANPLYLNLTNYTPLVRFAIFQSDGGPVPDGAVIQSASLQLYKQSYADTLQLNALLKPWTESQATWQVSQTGMAWSVGGASGAGTDYNATADAQVSFGFSPGWLTIDVTSRVQQWSSAAGANNGWRIAQISRGTNPKQFNSSEHAADITLRPKLTVVYSPPPSNLPPTVAMASPSSGASIGLGGSFALTANAGDADGSVTLVEYFANGGKIGQATSAPYSLTWVPAVAGSYSVTARATDNLGATTTSSPITVSVVPGPTTVVLQRGLGGYAGASDTFLDSNLSTTVRGGTDPLYLNLANYAPLLRFAIFQSDGGPVPDGAVIQSASLQLYKQYYADTLQLNALLKPWVESQATWQLSRTGTPWSAGGASGAGTDYNATADAQVAGGFNPGWVAFDVTSRVQQWSNAASANYGWRMKQTTTGSNAKMFNSSEFAADTTLRPKLTIVYQ